MPPKESLKILFVLNPISGGQSKAEWEAGIKEYFAGSEHTYQLYLTSGHDDKISVVHWVNTWKPDRVVAVGGDGTLKLVAEVLAGSGIPIGILPAGSANGMARELDIPTDLKEGLDVITGDHMGKIDLIRVNDREICLHLSDIGLNAQLVKYFEERGLRGKLGYAKGLLRLIVHKRLMRVRVETDTQTLVRDAFMVVLANARMYGTGAMINPDGDLQDGIFEVIIIRKFSLPAFFKTFFHSRNFNPAKIEILPAKKVVIDVKKKAYFQIDGEYKGRTRAITAVAEKQMLCMLLPKP